MIVTDIENTNISKVIRRTIAFMRCESFREDEYIIVIGKALIEKLISEDCQVFKVDNNGIFTFCGYKVRINYLVANSLEVIVAEKE